MADRPQGRPRKVASLAEARVKRAFDRIEARYRGKDTSRLEAFLAEQVEAEKAMSMSDVVRQAIDASGLSRNEIGRQAGISGAQISRFMTGQRSLTLESADKLAKVLKLKMVRGKRPRKKK